MLLDESFERRRQWYIKDDRLINLIDHFNRTYYQQCNITYVIDFGIMSPKFNSSDQVIFT